MFDQQGFGMEILGQSDEHHFMGSTAGIGQTFR
jgi:hypothetical protein